ncbi:MAG: trypsin-like peptidase domain-containing protein, partial [Bdellovibrionales bacterium]|nr:trypsin-like peptidase domain-containing protein [Bdellovibrionales bacterium]
MNRIKLNWTNITLILLLILVVTLLVTQFNKRPFQTNKNVIWMERSTSEKATDNLDIDFDFSKLNDAFVKLAKNLSPSVVNIYTSTKFESPNRQRDFRAPDDELFRHFFGPLFNLDQQFPFILPKESTTLGSGFIINENGVLITNSHIIRNMGQVANKIMIKFKGQKGKGFPASVVGLDVSTDIAVLKLEKAPAKVKPVYLGHSKDIQVGEWVMAIGNPFGHSNTVTVGIVSALGRELHSLESRNDFIQTSANINPGNSGGPLFNMKGEVIGINAAIDPRAQAIGFAIPIDLSKNVITQLIEKGEVTRGWLGIEITDITTEIKELLKVPVTTGVVVLSVGKGTPAENSGIKVYDVIVAIDDKKIATARELSQEIAHTKPGKIIDINLYRESNKKKIKVMVGKTTEQQKLESRVLSS